MTTPRPAPAGGSFFYPRSPKRIIKPSLSRYLDYIYADGKIVAIHVHNTTANADSIYYVHTDLLGSWDRIVDRDKNMVQSSHFDPWGNRMSATNWTQRQDGSSFAFHRGFTGHEHYDRFGIINMNARLYDPALGRFFSPDPQVQAPFSSQGFNRYSYCGNNPVMRTDPDGEFWHLVPFVAGFINLKIHSDEGDAKNFWQGLGYFMTGAVGGMMEGLSFNPYLTAARLVSTGVGLCVHPENAFRTWAGRYYFDENMLHGFTQALTRFTSERWQTEIGNIYTQIRNICGYVDRVDYFGGATYATDEHGEGWGVTFGNNIVISNDEIITGDFRDYIMSATLYRHEYGHSLDSQIWGRFYLLGIGAPSLLNCIWDYIFDTHTHKTFYAETLANFWGAHYFTNIYGVRWDFGGHPVPSYYGLLSKLFSL